MPTSLHLGVRRWPKIRVLREDPQADRVYQGWRVLMPHPAKESKALAKGFIQ